MCTSVRQKIRAPLSFMGMVLFWASLAFGQAVSGQPSAAGVDDLQPGAAIESIEKNAEGHKAGMQEGDVLLGWSRIGARGKIDSPFDLLTVEVEQKPKGAVRIEGLRGAQKQTWLLGPDAWGIRTRPVFPHRAVHAYNEGLALAEAGKWVEMAQSWRAIPSQTHSSSAGLDAWLFFHAAELQTEAAQWKAADESFQESLQCATSAGADIQGHLLRAWASTFEQRNDWTNAEKYYQQALATGQGASAENLTHAIDLTNLGNIARARGDLARAKDYYQQALRIRERLAPESLAAASNLTNLGMITSQLGAFNEAEDFCQRSLLIGKKLTPRGLEVASAMNCLGVTARRLGDIVKAGEYHQQALEIGESVAPGSLNTASSLSYLGTVAWRRGDLEKAEEYQGQALAIRQKLAPDGPDVAASLSNLGILAYERDDPDKADEYYSQSLAITQKLAPGSLAAGNTLSNLGLTAWERGDLAKAEFLYRQALEIHQRLAPGSIETGSILNNIGLVAWHRGDLSGADSYLHKALAVRQKSNPGSLDLVITFANLARVALGRGDLAFAEEYSLRALAVQDKFAPESRDAAESLNTLGFVAYQQGKLDQAENYLHRALAIREKAAPDSLDKASTLETLGAIAQQRGNLGKAEDYYLRAMNIVLKIGPHSLLAAGILSDVAGVFRERGEFGRAEEFGRQALSLYDELSVQSAEHAELLAGMASMMREQGKPDTAAGFFQQSVDVLESQFSHLGGTTEVRADFRGSYERHYKEYIDLMVSQKQPELAFHLLERSRARTLLETLAGAHTDIHRGADPELLSQEHSLRADINAKSERRIRLRSENGAPEQINAVTKQISELVSKYQAVEEQIRSNSPLYAALTQPQPLTAKKVQHQLLDPDSLLLAYSLGEERSYVFSVTSDSLAVFTLPKRSEIERVVRRVYESLTTRNYAPRGETKKQNLRRSVERDAGFSEPAAELSRMLLDPVAGLLKGKRLLIVADGALHYVPFALLPEPQGSSNRKPNTAAPLVLEHEIVNLPSASVMAALRQERMGHQRPPDAVAVLADPVFDRQDSRVVVNKSQIQHASITTMPSSPLTRSASDVGLNKNGRLLLPRLRYTRLEAKAILAVAPGRSMAALDFDASLGTATSPRLARYRIIHFATHGLVDSEHPELSGLVLSLVDKDGQPQDGFLQLQDIYNLNLQADLVVLSACETALGKEISGEGLIGLTRGFMYAGASRVVASLWRVSDVATAKLMAEFYRAMEKDGMPASAALRAAQIKMLKQKRWSDPYYWAAFQIQGEWR